MTVDELIDGWEAAWTGRQVDAFSAVTTVRVQYEDPLTAAPLVGPGELAEHAGLLWRGFPNVRLERSGERLSNGRYVAAPCRLIGTHRGPIGGLPASGRELSIQTVFYCELEGGLLHRVRAFFDAYAAAVQLGILPARGTLGERALLALRGFGLRAGSRTG
jgi:steroid delta-isomerase-like uncharacterized protein